VQPHRQTEIPQLAARGFFEDVGHPVNPRTPHSTLPFTFSRGPERVHIEPAPLLGQHNHELLTELGLSEEEIDELAAQGVIGIAPAMGPSKAKTG
jgi:crotonobetainyl-CoA:carnitine CoA-transferase CaiB-like acyl-CoA transferase